MELLNLDYEGKVIIVGGGPGAAYAVEGAKDAGIDLDDIVILAPKISWPQGAFWLKEPLLPLDSMTVSIILFGTAANYSRKMWSKVVPTSADSLDSTTVKEELGWDAGVHLRAWWSQHPYTKLSRFLTTGDINRLAYKNKLILTFDPHQVRKFAVVRFPVWQGMVDAHSQPICMYNGNEAEEWVRMTVIGRKVSVEYPVGFPAAEADEAENERWGTHGTTRMMPDLVPGTEPLTEEYMMNRGYLLVGRWATYDRKFLSYQTRGRVKSWLTNLEK